MARPRRLAREAECTVDAREVHLARKVTLQMFGQTAGRTRRFSSPRASFTERVGRGLAVLGGNQGRQLFGVGDEQLAKREEMLVRWRATTHSSQRPLDALPRRSR